MSSDNHYDMGDSKKCNHNTVRHLWLRFGSDEWGKFFLSNYLHQSTHKCCCTHMQKKKQHQLECTWMHESQIDWIYQGPVSACLVINSIFLLRIMWVSRTISNLSNEHSRNAQKTEKVSFIKKCVFKVLIIKLRSNNNVETRQYRKATKALLVLIPLLGITYLVVMAGPAEGLGKYIFAIIRALLISTQVWGKCFFLLPNRRLC